MTTPASSSSEGDRGVQVVLLAALSRLVGFLLLLNSRCLGLFIFIAIVFFFLLVDDLLDRKKLRRGFGSLEGWSIVVAAGA